MCHLMTGLIRCYKNDSFYIYIHDFYIDICCYLIRHIIQILGQNKTTSGFLITNDRHIEIPLRQFLAKFSYRHSMSSVCLFVLCF